MLENQAFDIVYIRMINFYFYILNTSIKNTKDL